MWCILVGHNESPGEPDVKVLGCFVDKNEDDSFYADSRVLRTLLRTQSGGGVPIRAQSG